MIKKAIFSLLLLASFQDAKIASAKINILSSTTDLASIAQVIGGERVKTESIARGRSNPHFVEVLPSYMIKAARADIYLKVGMGLDLWADYIIDGSRNSKIKIIDCSQDILALEKPSGKVNASMGDVHPQGNPHYWLDPDNGIIIARKVEGILEEKDPKGASYYRENLTKFINRIEEEKARWRDKAAKLEGLEIITYHNSWPYFCRSFGIKVVGYVEPKPGIEPTPSHTSELVELMKSRNIKIIGKEPYYSDRIPKTIARLTGAKIVNLPPSVGGSKEARDYFSLFDTLLYKLNSAIEE